MLVFQTGAQKLVPQDIQAFKPQVQIYTGNEAQRIMLQVSKVSEQMLTAIHKPARPDAF